MSVNYQKRTVRQWISMAQNSDIAITDFQRSYVWPNDKAARYIKAIFDDNPVGLFLMLEASEDLQFEPREFNRFEIIKNKNQVKEFILDGQQRMTSLLQALHGKSDKRYFLKMSDISSKKLEVKDVIFLDTENPRAREYETPKNAYNANLVPFDIFQDEADEDGITPLNNWCIQITDDMHELLRFQNSLQKFIAESFLERDIWYCLLPRTINSSKATEIFIETNTSSVEIKRFDIAVANARGEYDDDLRLSISNQYSKKSDFKHYFRDDQEEWIPHIGEWMLKVACLQIDKAPQQKYYLDALKSLYERKKADKYTDLDNLYEDLVWALRYASENGAATQNTLPSWPPLHVIAAIRPLYVQIREPEKIHTARNLLRTYYWRSLFSNRYEAQANTRLYDDYCALRDALNEIEESGIHKTVLPIFEEKDHPIYSSNDIYRLTGWIGSSSRLGRAIASLVLSEQPPDWITGQQLTPETIRELDKNNDLDRHHIFTRHILKKNGEKQDRVQNGLNGVILDRRTNLRLGRAAPEEYIRKVLNPPNKPKGKKPDPISEEELRSRIERHLVPYDEMKKPGGIITRYNLFLEKRAKMISTKIELLTSF